MKLKHLRLIALIVLFLGLVELGLEVRASRRGFASILFGRARVRFPEADRENPEGPMDVGPAEGFPFRSPIVGRDRNGGAIRVWFASASYAEDIAVPVPRVFPNLLASYLTTPDRRFEVLNASKAGLSFGSNTRQLLEEGPAWAPDYAVLYGLSLELSDLSDRLLGGSAASDGTEQAPEENRGAQGIAAGPFLALSRSYERTTLYALLKANVTSLITRERILADNLPASADPLFRERVEAFVDAAETVGSIPILTTFATSHGLEAAGGLPLDVELFMLRWNPHLSPDGWLEAVARFNDIIRRVAREREIVLIELEPDLTGRHDLFRDFVHLRPRGHREAARLLADGLARAFAWDRDSTPAEAGR